jgi:hypothetical protein
MKWWEFVTILRRRGVACATGGAQFKRNLDTAKLNAIVAAIELYSEAPVQLVSASTELRWKLPHATLNVGVFK